jgi:catechol 1,2-dioxygenase
MHAASSFTMSTPDSRPHSSPLGSPADAASLLQAVLRENRCPQSPRLQQVLASLVRHLHAFAQETQLNYEELELGLQFLNAIGQATGPKKNEAILLADVLGVSTLVQLQDAQRILAQGGTEPALIGPFWRAHQPVLPDGADTSPQTRRARGWRCASRRCRSTTGRSPVCASRSGRPRRWVCTKTRTRPRPT